jgi:hypothetical protein
MFAKLAQANDAWTVDLGFLTVMMILSEQIRFKKLVLKSPVLTHCYKEFERGVIKKFLFCQLKTLK